MSKEKYGITDAHYLCDSAIFNTETNEILRLYQVCEMLNQQDKQIADLEAKLAEKEQLLKDSIDVHEIQGKQEYKLRYELAGATETIEVLRNQLAEKEKNNLILYSMLYQTLEKQDPENVSSRIDQMTGETLDKQSEWFKTNRVCDELQKQLAVTEKALKLAREYMFNVMCADDVPFESWFIECAKNDWKPS